MTDLAPLPVPDSPFAIPAELPTIEVVHPTDPTQSIVINAEDFDPTKHQRWSEQRIQETGVRSQEKKKDQPVREKQPKPRRGRPPKSARSTSPTIAAVPEPETPTEILVDAAVSVPTAAVERLAALEAMEASDIKAIAEKHGIPRPRAGGWKAAIPRIVAVEFPEDEPSAAS
ncbi:MAG: hypothetical protein KME16_28370 [Scytolyngbya sp. HA4215-MV1]|jgi:hypothetical protein|nr:hypothetical protein [Scytolyngbya sp. HA4215-MV1]